MLKSSPVSLPALAAMTALMLAIAGCAAPPTAAPTAPPSTPDIAVDLSGIKSYLLEKTGRLKQATAALKETSDRYYALAKEANFDYVALFAARKDEVIGLIQTARERWMIASPLYEQMEGIVAGTPSLAEFDVIIDAGASKEEDPQDPAPIDVALPDGRLLEKPGNLFGVTESTLWGTFEAFRVPGQFDFNGDGRIEFGESLPDANVLKGGVDALDEQAGKLAEAAQAWTPTESDAFTALVVMVPTMSEYFDSWKNSRFVAGEASTQRDFVAISRLADIQDILSSLIVVHENISPMIRAVDAAQDDAIRRGLSDLKVFVAGVHKQETGGKRFKPEEADVLGKEAQDRADAITGRIAQMAARLGIKIEQ
ncbi:MAG: imelysin family protein [Anaerolineae bacterium]|nr:EfeM/EfeO family lipoprotein [Candidatus Roseilinea sp.]MDW8449340.1 imelysin family protein [Anaerolineae bacterium]